MVLQMFNLFQYVSIQCIVNSNVIIACKCFASDKGPYQATRLGKITDEFAEQLLKYMKTCFPLMQVISKYFYKKQLHIQEFCLDSSNTCYLRPFSQNIAENPIILVSGQSASPTRYFGRSTMTSTCQKSYKQAGSQSAKGANSQREKKALEQAPILFSHNLVFYNIIERISVVIL